MTRGALVLALAVLLLALAAPRPAEAHRLKVFATVEDGRVSGYGFFVGGGRPAGARVVARDGTGRVLFEGTTDGDGAFAFRPEGVAGDLTITLTVGDGHGASTTIAAARLGAAPAPAPAPAPQPAGEDPGEAAAPADPEALRALIEESVAAAVSREMRPLLEAYAEAEARVRFNDVVGGVGMIVGLAGVALWARSRLRP